MIVYYFIFLLILACACVNSIYLKYANISNIVSNNQMYHNKLLEFLLGKYGIVLVALVVFAGIRSVNVGLDNPMYYNYYFELNNNLGQGWSLYSMEYGYRILNFILVFIDMPYTVLQFVIAIITISAFYVFINKFSKIKWISWLLFLSLGIYAQMINLNRQIISISVILLAIVCLQDKKYFKFILSVVIASLFHKSALICLILLPIKFLKLNNKIIILYLILTLACGLMFNPIVMVVSKLLGAKYFDLYLNSDSGFIMDASKLDVAFTFGMALIFMVLYLLRKKFISEENNKQQQNDLFLTLFLIVVLLRLIGIMAKCSTLLNRLTPYFFFSIIVLIPNYLYTFCKTYKKLSLWCIAFTILCCAVYMYALYEVKLSCGVVPYSTFWEVV